MKKSTMFKIFLVVILVLFIATLVYRIYQVKNFQKDLRETTGEEKQKIIDILDENMNIAGYDLTFGNVFTDKNQTFVRVQLKKDNLKKSYLINLDSNTLVS